jgi:hypothetical protein
MARGLVGTVFADECAAKGFATHSVRVFVLGCAQSFVTQRFGEGRPDCSHHAAPLQALPGQIMAELSVAMKDFEERALTARRTGGTFQA